MRLIIHGFHGIFPIWMALSMALMTAGDIVAAEPINDKDAAIQILESFCQTNFMEPVASMSGAVKLSPEAKKRWRFISGNQPVMVEDYNYPIVIVSTYHVSGVQLTGDSGVGKVIYEQLAHTRVHSGNDAYGYPIPREIIPEYIESHMVEYNLRKINGKWYVYDPPIETRVSLATVTKYYFGQATSFLPDDFWIDLKFSNGQRRNIAIEFSDISVLMQISADYLNKLRERYKEAGGPDHPDRERQKRVKASYTGKWNVVVIPELKSK